MMVNIFQAVPSLVHSRLVKRRSCQIQVNCCVTHLPMCIIRDFVDCPVSHCTEVDKYACWIIEVWVVLGFQELLSRSG